MGRRASSRPTDGELELLAVLWERGGSTVREIHRTVLKSRELHYNTVLKTLQIMLEKGLVTRDDSDRPQRYEAAVSRARTERHLIRDLMDRVFGGSALKMIMRAASAKKASSEEIREIRRQLSELEDGK